MKKIAALLFALALPAVALAQQVPNHSIPISRGPNVSGWSNSVGPCGPNVPIVGTGATTDPTCSSGGAYTGFANPSSSIGLTPKNGTATTAMRSDAAPALDTTIAPTMSGQWTFSLVPIWPTQSAHFVWIAPTAGGAPAFRALVGSDLPNPSATTIGGVQSFAVVPHQFLTQISPLGVISAAQPACADISNAGTVCTANTGTSGAVLGFLNGNNTYSGSDTFSGAVNFTSTFQVNGNTITWPGVPTTVAALNINDQTLAGGANVTTLAQTTGNITVDCGARPLQSISNNGAWTITAPANDGSCAIKVTNGASAATPTMSGFSVGSNTGDPIDNTSGHIFFLFVYRIGGTSTYSWKAAQ